MKYETKIFYWYCPSCGKKETYAEAVSLNEAKIELEKHEVEKHKGKQVGTFGLAKKGI